MRRFTLFLLLLGMFLAVGLVVAQEEETILYVLLNCDCEEYPIFAEIMNQFETNLADYSISIQYISPETETNNTPDWPEFLSIRLAFDVAQEPDGSILFIGYNYRYSTSSQWLNRAFAEISPVLTSNLSTSDILGECRPISSCDFQVDLLTAMSLYMLNRCDLAEDLLSAINQPAYKQHIINEIRANCAILNGNYLIAEEILENTTLLWENYPVELSSKLAWLYLQSEQNEAATELMNATVEIGRENLEIDGHFLPILLIEALKYRAQILALAFDYTAAIADMNAAIELVGESGLRSISLAELYTLRGKIIFLIYEWDRVLENFNHAIELDPNYAPAYFERGILYYTMTQRENALADFRHYLELEPDGLYAEEAAHYIESIQIELDALGG